MPDAFETRLIVEGGTVLDLCFQRVCEPPVEPPHVDIGQGDVAWVVLADPEDNPFCVVEDRAAYADSDPRTSGPG